NVTGREVTLWGLAFKPQTDDIREAPSVAIIKELLALGVKVHAHDPIAISAVKKLFGGAVEFFENGYDALKGAEAWMVVTEWNEFRRPDFERITKLMKQPVLFDGRNLYDAKEMKDRGFAYYGIGR
ncbi:MAG: UDP-glucose 6-dehydrogenase, partial [Ignavibacteriales bacterium]|nr:UDP-glucose 6-dehydrogenase [Ignavibacteriales bacterium]